MPAGRPLTHPIKKVLGFDEAMVAAVDKWRRKQKDKPNFSQAVRRLVALALEAKK